MLKINVIHPYDNIYKTKKKTIIMYNPRISGKTIALVQCLITFAIKYPDHDIVIARANYNSLADSLYAEILKMQDDLGIKRFFQPYKAPLTIKAVTGTRIYFMGIGGSDMSRTRGLRTSKPISLILFDEVQQLKSELNLKQAQATFIRALDDKIDSKMIISGNPEQPKGHWWNVFCKQQRELGAYEFIDATYLDVINYISKDALEEIEIERKLNPQVYKFMYLGEIDDLMGGAYAQFKREVHYITQEQANKIFAGETIEYVIFGGDGAISHDSTAIVPVAIMTSGRAVVLERFFYDPLANGVILSTMQLVDLIKIYFNDLDKKYRFYENNVGVVWAIDTASQDLIAQMNYEMPEWQAVKAFTQKSILRNNGVVNDAFAKGMLYIINYGGQYNYSANRQDTNDKLVEELESVVWKDYKLDPAIPNDCTDALTYGVNYYFLNPDNLRFPETKKSY